MGCTAGQERYRSLAPMYYRGASCAIIVYDITSLDSLMVQKCGLMKYLLRLLNVKYFYWVINDLDKEREVKQEDVTNL